MNIERDPRKTVSAEPEGGFDSPTFTALHYALATKVDALVVRQTEQATALASLGQEMRAPKPVPWGPLVSLVVGILAIVATIGGLVQQSISERIGENSKEIASVEARSNKRDDSYAHKSEVAESIQLLRETARRLEDVQTAARKAEQEINVTKAEFGAVTQSIRDRQNRNEAFIEELRKAETLNGRINQLYDLYRLLQSQAHEELIKQITLHDQLQLQRSNGK